MDSRLYSGEEISLNYKLNKKGFKMILDGDLDEVAENDFYMKGGIDGVIVQDKS